MIPELIFLQQVLLKIQVFWKVTMCAEDSMTMNVKTLQSFETSVTAHPTKVSQQRKHEYLTLSISKVVSCGRMNVNNDL